MGISSNRCMGAGVLVWKNIQQSQDPLQRKKVWSTGKPAENGNSHRHSVERSCEVLVPCVVRLETRNVLE
jgi:hypothetical protein